MPTNLPTESVAADMDRIFEPLAQRAPVRAAGASDARTRVARPGALGGGRRLAILAPVVLAIAAGGLALGYVGEQPTRPQRANATVASSDEGRRAIAAPSVASQAVSIVAPSVRTGSEPVVRDGGEGVADPAPAPVPVRASVPSERLRGDRAARAPSRSMAGRAASRAASGAGLARDGRGAATGGRCVAGSLEDRCIYQDVLDADSRLRLAYRRAQRGGVSNRDLATVTRRWSRAREMSLDDPDGTIQRYDQLADTLDRARRDRDGDEGFE